MKRRFHSSVPKVRKIRNLGKLTVNLTETESIILLPLSIFLVFTQVHNLYKSMSEPRNKIATNENVSCANVKNNSLESNIEHARRVSCRR